MRQYTLIMIRFALVKTRILHIKTTGVLNPQTNKVEIIENLPSAFVITSSGTSHGISTVRPSRFGELILLSRLLIAKVKQHVTWTVPHPLRYWDSYPIFFFFAFHARLFCQRTFLSPNSAGFLLLLRATEITSTCWSVCKKRFAFGVKVLKLHWRSFF